ncbi:light-regulated protein, chloroplastic [Ricinus communis]|uniref:Light-regulated protein, putative n=1 Tax=Ricinus communis TaxID=3988 RepID=B9RGY6_RICCO|nr:light-regulated protein, chloroplastic [Ricinus communis]EEF49348.1 Light-regulated protein precursor, putative [Ricinus communis]|eukprot:XP_002512845.1 light-regulated protein, chloroplastic [Ricinus communis]
MQAALSIAPPVFPVKPSKNLSQVILSPPQLGASSLAPRASPIKAAYATVAYDTSTVDYSSVISVFPAEACETLGGDACLANIFPEVKLEARNDAAAARIASEPIEREYLEYNDAKTVFCAEACDDLGGEFCSREYQRGVY